MSSQRNKSTSNNNIFDRLSCKPRRSNVVTPNIFVSPTWLRDDQPPGMEIIELNSSNEEISPKEPSRNDRRHAWSYVNNEEMQEIEHSYKINERARERRRLQNANTHHSVATYGAIEPNNGINHSNAYIDDKIEFNRDVNCFDMINNYLVNSDTSSDGDYANIEVVTSADIIMSADDNWDQYNNNYYNEDIITYDTDLDQETRTIWIYSFKNKHLLGDDDFKTVACNESSNSSNTTDSSGELRKDSGDTLSPKPATYIPRLDLSLVPTLSTVVEISERNLQVTPERSVVSVKSTSRTKKVRSNNWCMTKNAKSDGRSVGKHEKSTSVINWMGLSPRERRRVLKDKSVSDSWVPSYLNLSETRTDRKEESRCQMNKAVQNDAVKVKVDVEVHVDSRANGDTVKIGSNNACKPVNINTDDITSIHRIKYADAANEDSQKDGGDNNIKVVPPAIRLISKQRKSNISNPIENLESPDWISEREENETRIYDYVLERSESILDTKNNINNVDDLWMKNTVPFLKPSDWNKFKPIADSPISYHLSIGSIEERKTWFRRLINFCNCCK